MKKVFIAYDSRTGKPQQMAEYIAEGVRIFGNEAVVLTGMGIFSGVAALEASPSPAAEKHSLSLSS